MKPAKLTRINSLLAGKNPIRETPKGFRYKIYNKKTRNPRDLGKCTKGRVCYFSDYGPRANIQALEYSYGVNHKKHSLAGETWFQVKNNRLVITKRSPGQAPGGTNQFRNMSNKPFQGIVYFHHTVPFIKKWARREGLKVKSKYLKYDTLKFYNVLCYPNLEYLFDINDKIPGASFLNPVLTKALLKPAGGLNDVLDNIFGYHGKNLKKFLMGLDNFDPFYRALAGAALLKGLVSNDYNYEIFTNNDSLLLVNDSDIKALRFFLKNFEQETIKKFVLPDTQLDQNGGQLPNILRRSNRGLLDDAAREFYLRNYVNKHPDRLITLPDSTDLEEIHNHIFNRVRAIQLVENNPLIDYIKFYQENELESSFSIDKFTIKMPEDSTELIRAGELLSNCLGSYTRRHTRERLIYLVYEGEILKYAISINSDQCLEQFYGKYNQLPDKEDYKLIADLLKKKELVKETSSFDKIMFGPKETTFYAVNYPAVIEEF